MEKILIILICFPAYPLWAQYLEGPLVSASGYQGQAAGYLVEYSLGEPAIGTFTEGGFTFLVGFHQPSIASATDIPLIEGRNYFNVYPNPARSFLYVQFYNNGKDRIRQLSLIDMRGVTVMQIPGHELDSDPFQISLDGMHPGLYLLQILFTDGARQVKIVSFIH